MALPQTSNFNSAGASGLRFFRNGHDTVTIDNFVPTGSQVLEPSAFVFGGRGLLALVGRRRRG